MFINAIGIWGKDKDRLNETLYFRLSFKKDENLSLTLTSSNFYRVFLNGKFIAYGPSRSAHNIFEVDEYELKHLKKRNYLIIEVNSTRANTFYTLNQKPFLKAEVFKDGDSLFYTGKHFKCYEDIFRVREVDRFSYQRGFSEVYALDENYHQFLSGTLSLNACDIEKVEYGTFIKRIPDYIKFEHVKFKQAEKGEILLDESKPIHDDRYFHMDCLKIFKKEEIKDNINETVSKFTYKLISNENQSNLIQNDQFLTFKNSYSLTGFIETRLEVLEDSIVYIIFDEIDMNEYHERKGSIIDISPFRNTTQNVIYYSLKKGSYNLLSFEPYTAKFIRVICLSGKIKINRVGILSYRNSSVRFKYNFKNKKINKVIESAINTFKDNAVDILTDCPSRERAGWLCDSYFTSKVEKVLTGDNKVERNFLNSYADYNDNCKIDPLMIPMCYPSEQAEKQYIPNWSLFYILELEDYFLRTNDSELINRSKEKVIDLINYFKQFENEFGLLENLKNWVFVEWSKAGDPEFIKGVNFPTNMLYSKALKIASKILNDDSLFAKGQKLQETIKKMAFCGDFFVDNAIRNENNELIKTQNVSETCQYYAFYFLDNLETRYSKLFKKLVNKFGPNREEKTYYPNVYKSNVFIGNYLRLMILNRNSYYSQTYKEIISYYYKMAKLTSTLWEHDSPHASLNHGFASYVLISFIEANFGLKEISLKDKRIVIDKAGLHKDGEISIPVLDDYLILRCKNGEQEVIAPNDFSIVYKGE